MRRPSSILRPSTLLVLLIGAVAILLLHSRAEAQCDRWLAGPLDSYDYIEGEILASVVWDPDGGGPAAPLLVVGGTFQRAGGAVVNHIAAWDGYTWTALGSGTDGPVRALAVLNGQIVAAGGFQFAGGILSRFAARWNGAYWSAMGDGMYGNEGVFALGFHQGELYAGGDFLNHIRRWDESVMAWVQYPTGLNGTVRALASFAGSLFAGGDFTGAIGGPSLSRIAKWSGGSWTLLPDGLDATVRAMIVFNGDLIIAGDFNAPPEGTAHVVRWNGAYWDPMDCGSPCGLGPGVNSLFAFQGNLFAGGTFSGGGSGAPAISIAQWTGFDWASTGDVQFVGQVRALGSHDNQLLALGSRISRWTFGAWEPHRALLETRALAVQGSRMVIGGAYYQRFPGSLDVYHLVAFDGLELAPVGGGTNAPVNALTGYAEATYPFDNHLIVGGEFTSAGGNAVNRVARWTESTAFPFDRWSAMGPGFNGNVHALEQFAGQTVAGGVFTLSGASPRNYVARWDGSAWQPMGTGMNGPVFALRGYKSSPTTTTLLAGGQFTSANGGSASSVAYWTSSTTQADTPWQPLGAGLDGTVYAVERHGGSTYAAGWFSSSGGTALSNVARFVPGTGWVDVGGGLDGPVHALRSMGGYLYAAGAFTGYVSRWDGTSWVVVQGGYQGLNGPQGTSRALAAWHEEVWVGGAFATNDSKGVARFTPTGTPWIVEQPYSQSVSEGEDVSFTMRPADPYGGTFAWRKNGVPLANGPTGHGSVIAGSTASTLQIQQAAVEDSGSYDCVFTSGACGAVTGWAASLEVSAVVGVGPPSDAHARGLTARPNPFADRVEIAFSLPESSPVEAAIFDVSGRFVRRLAEGTHPAGAHAIAWDGRYDTGRPSPAGVYLVVLRTPVGIETRRIVRLNP